MQTFTHESLQQDDSASTDSHRKVLPWGAPSLKEIWINAWKL